MGLQGDTRTAPAIRDPYSSASNQSDRTMPKRLSFQLYSARKFPSLAATLAMLAGVG